MTPAGCFAVRNALLRAFLEEAAYDGILLSRIDNFAMATGGKRNYVNRASDLGACALFVAKDGRTAFIGNAIEAPRMMEEELAGLVDEAYRFPWFAASAAKVAGERFPGRLCSDDGSLGDNVNGKLAYLRSLLTEAELEKYRRLGRRAAEALCATLDTIEAGTTEAEILATLTAEAARRGCFLPVALVAADERIAQYRHPLPAAAALLGKGEGRRVERYVMVAGGFYAEGLTVSMTRFKRVAELPAALEERYRAICAVDALMQEATRPGATLGEVFAVCQAAYLRFGFREDEWHYHHQGGATGYAGRTCKGAPGETFRILEPRYAARASEWLGKDIALGQAFAWNPSGPGVKSEDTFLLLPDGTQEIVTRTPSLPRVDLAGLLGRETPVQKYAIATP